MHVVQHYITGGFSRYARLLLISEGWKLRLEFIINTRKIVKLNVNVLLQVEIHFRKSKTDENNRLFIFRFNILFLFNFCIAVTSLIFKKTFIDLYVVLNLHYLFCFFYISLEQIKEFKHLLNARYNQVIY